MINIATCYVLFYPLLTNRHPGNDSLDSRGVLLLLLGTVYVDDETRAIVTPCPINRVCGQLAAIGINWSNRECVSVFATSVTQHNLSWKIKRTSIRRGKGSLDCARGALCPAVRCSCVIYILGYPIIYTSTTKQTKSIRFIRHIPQRVLSVLGSVESLSIDNNNKIEPDL